MPEFIFATCQIGAEPALKAEIQRSRPDFRFAFSRPGFLTFKLPEGHGLAADFDLKSTFARAYGFSLGPVAGRAFDAMAAEVWRLYGPGPAGAVHVWQRDLDAAGRHGYEPAITSGAIEARAAILKACPDKKLAASQSGPFDEAKQGDFVLDCILVEPNKWWVGHHRAKSPCSRFAGGMFLIEPKEPPISRAWYKVYEALAWSRLPIPPGSRIADLGSAPGGTSQALLEMGHWVLGIDPAEMSSRVLQHPRFTHLRLRTTQVRRREFRNIHWLLSDMSVAPDYTLDAAESIVTRADVRIHGMLLTLKLLEWRFSERIGDYVGRVRSWGFDRVWTRQLAHNRQEICLAALKGRANSPFNAD